MYPGLVSCPFYAIPIYPFKFMKFLFTCIISFQHDLHFGVVEVKLNGICKSKLKFQFVQV